MIPADPVEDRLYLGIVPVVARQRDRGAARPLDLRRRASQAGEPAGHILESVRELEHQDLPASEKLRAVARNHTAVLEETFDFAAVYLHEIAGRHLNAEWREMDREYVAAVERIITEGIADGSFAPSTNPRVATMSFIGALNWLTRWWTPTGPMSASDVADQIAGTLLSGLLTRKRARPPAAPPRALEPRSRRVTKE